MMKRFLIAFVLVVVLHPYARGGVLNVSYGGTLTSIVTAPGLSYWGSVGDRFGGQFSFDPSVTIQDLTVVSPWGFGHQFDPDPIYNHYQSGYNHGELYESAEIGGGHIITMDVFINFNDSSLQLNQIVDKGLLAVSGTFSRDWIRELYLDGTIDWVRVDTAWTPEPSAIAMIATGLPLGLGFCCWKHRRAAA
jgi:hypothetical protein